MATRKEKKQRRIERIAAGTAGVAGAVGGAASIRDPGKRMGKHMGSRREDLMKLIGKAKPGDVILTGRGTDYGRIDPDITKNVANKIFFRGLKTGTQSYTPHGMLVYGPGKARLSTEGKKGRWRKTKKTYPTQIANQADELERYNAADIPSKYDRAVLMRPKKELTKPQKSRLKKYVSREVKRKRPYSHSQAVLQGAMGTVLPKKVRECFTKRKGKASYCTGFPAEAMERAGTPVVKGKGSAALAKDITSSAKLKPVGWAGKGISKIEKLKVVHAPRAIRALAYGAGAAGAAYGVAKLIGKMRGKKKIKTPRIPKARTAL